MLKTVVVLPDTTALLNFGIAGRLDLLERFVASGAAWCGTVSNECADQAKRYGLAELWPDARKIFGDPWFPEGAEHQDVQVLRTSMLQPGDSGSHRHLGEAESITVATAPRFARAWRGRRPAFVTDDLDAQKHARRLGMVAFDTWAVLALLLKSGSANFDECGEAGQRIVDAGRPRPRGENEKPTTDVRGWLAARMRT